MARLVPGVLGLALLTACGAGQITQTDTEQSGVNGASGMVGAMAVRNAQLAFPGDARGAFQPGSSAKLIVSFVNTGLTTDTLTRITSPAVQSVTIDGSPTGTKDIPGEFLVSSGQDTDGSNSPSGANPQPPASGQPSGAAEPGAPTSGAAVPSAPGGSATPATPGRVTIELIGIKSINGQPLRAGLTIPMTFYFAHAGQLTLPQVPVGAESSSS